MKVSQKKLYDVEAKGNQNRITWQHPKRRYMRCKRKSKENEITASQKKLYDIKAKGNQNRMKWQHPKRHYIMLMQKEIKRGGNDSIPREMICCPAKKMAEDKLSQKTLIE